MKQHLKHINRRLTDEERARHARIREEIVKEIPPKPGAGRKPSPPGIPSQIRREREARRLTWYALAKLAGIPNQATIRDIEQGKDVKLSNLQAVAGVLGRNPGTREKSRVRPRRADGHLDGDENRARACSRVRQNAVRQVARILANAAATVRAANTGSVRAKRP